jgi:hypothetical protein
VARVSGHGRKVKPEVVEFMQIVMGRLKVQSPRELGRMLGMVSADEERRVYRWVAGTSAPNFFHTLRLLDASGMLNSEVAGWYGSRREDDR